MTHVGLTSHCKIWQDESKFTTCDQWRRDTPPAGWTLYFLHFQTLRLIGHRQ